MRHRRQEAGLTLIEILLALIVMVVGIVGILALFPPALESARLSMEETQAAIVAESVAHGLANGVRFANYNAVTNQWEAVFTHDLKEGSNYVKYPFLLPPIDTNGNGTSDEGDWVHHPDGKSAPTKGDPEKDPDFELKGDGWTAATHDSVQANDYSDPYHQFSFSFDIRKINTLDYLVGTPKPDGSGNYSLGDLENLVKLYEFRIHVFRKRSLAGGGGSGGTATGSGGGPGPGAGTTVSSGAGAPGDKVLIATVTNRVSTK